MRCGKLLVLISVFHAALLVGCHRITPVRNHLAMYHYNRSRRQLSRNELDRALKELARAVKYNPKLSVAHASAGDIHRRRGNHELAMQSYENACKSDPYAFRAHYNLAWTYQKLADAGKVARDFQNYLRKAVRTYLRAVAIRPGDFETNLNLSACYYRIGKYDLAEKYCKDAVRIKSDSPHAYSNLGIIYDSQNRLYEAIRAYKASLEIDTQQPRILFNLGSTYMRQNRLKSAVNAFELAIGQYPADSASYEQIGACFFRMRCFPKSLEAYQKAAELNPKSACAYRGIGVACMSQYLLDPKQRELRDKALSAWYSSLEILPAQQDLVRLMRKYTPTNAAGQL